jgi:KDO2-lipid IV(A) lauroyltransferase
MKATLFRMLGALPLPINHLLGSLAGLIAFTFSARHRELTRANLALFNAWNSRGNAISGIRSAIEQGKGLSELAIAWTATLTRIYSLVKACTGWEHVEAAKAQGKAIIFVTPHLGCYDIAGRYLESRTPIMALYRPPKQAWLEPIMQAGRQRGGGSTAPADASGVRQLLRTLKLGGSIVMLPDQVPAPELGGDGVWAPFFGKPAYTMTLLPRLAQSADAVVLLFYARRLPWGRGYAVHIEPPMPPFAEDKSDAATMMNRALEQLIAQAPAQYLWGYNRYKHPAGAPLPPESCAP